MSDQFVGEIRIVGFNFPPNGWAYCNGQILAISQNTALFSLLGTQFGGNGTSNYALPNFQAAIPIAQGNGAGLTQRFMGETSGEQSVTLLQSEMPGHNHRMNADSDTATSASPAGTLPAVPLTGPRRPNQLYTATGPVTTAMAANSMLATGGNQPHNNLQPYLTLNFCISLVGIYPARG